MPSAPTGPWCTQARSGRPGAADGQRAQQGDDRRAPRDRPARVLVSPLAVDRSLFRPGAPTRSSSGSSTCRSASWSTPRTCGRTRTTAGCSRRLRSCATASSRSSSPVSTSAACALEGAAARLGLSGRVRHLGFVDRRALAPPLPPCGRHGLPKPVRGLRPAPLEALACGCPVTASRAASLPEVLRGHASLFDPGDPEAIAAGIEWLLTAAPPRAGEDWRRFTWAECARVHRAAYALAAAG